MGVCIKTKHSEFTMDMGYGSFNRLRNKIAEYVPEKSHPGTINFLEQPDCDGKLTYKECQDLFKDIVNMPDDNDQYGYVYSKYRTLESFKFLIKTAMDSRCNLYWR